MKQLLVVVATALIASASLGTKAAPRDNINVVGSSTVFPFAKVVAERFGRTSEYRSPTVESTGTGGGFKEFCRGLGVNHPDITNASRAIKPSEFDDCLKNGVKDIIEVLIGFDGIVLANAIEGPKMHLSRRQLYLALAKKVPNPVAPGTLVKNPYQRWSDIDAALPDLPIIVYGPPPTSGTRDAYVELVMEGGCASYPALQKMRQNKPSKFRRACHILRDDGAFIDAGENDNLIVQKLVANPEAMGIFGFSFLDQNSDKVQAARIDDALPNFKSIGDDSYPISRPLYFYVKKSHIGVIPGLQDFLREFTSERAWGEEGYLAEKGMVPLDDASRAEIYKRVKQQEILSFPKD